MGSLKGVRCVIIGDVVGSRHARDRRALHDRLTEHLSRVSADLQPGEEFWLTAGDEFQGVFDELGDALAATTRLRLALLPDIDVRFGVGLGEVEVFDEESRLQDGPGWWAARDAIDETKQRETHASTRLVRTTFRSAVTDDRAPAVNAALLCRDQMMGSLDDRSIRILRGLMAGTTQTDIAAIEGVSVAAISQRVRNHGLEVLVRAEEQLAELT